MPKSEYLSEHKRLVKVLKHPTKAGLKSEVAEQSEDLRKAQSMKKNPPPRFEKSEKGHGKAHEKAETKRYEKAEHGKARKKAK